MKKILCYFQLECKKFIVALPGILSGILLISVLLLGFLFVCNLNKIENEDSNTIQIGVAAKEDEPYLDWMISTIENMESLEFSCQFTKLPQSDAINKLNSGALDAVFIIPENYVASIIEGKERPLIIRFGNGDSTVTGVLVRQIGDAASRFMIDTQAGIYAIRDFYYEKAIPNASQDQLDLNLTYLETILARNLLVEEEKVSPNGGLSGTGYFLASGILLFLLFLGLTCPDVLQPEVPAFRENLYRIGIHTGTQTLVQFSAFTTMFACIYLLFSVLFSLGISLAGISISDIEPNNFGKWIFCFLQILPVLFPVCALIQFAYETVNNKIISVLFLFLLILILGYLSGCFYPITSLPYGIRIIAPFLPVRIMFEYITGCLTKNYSVSSLLGMMGYSAVFIGISATLKTMSVRREH